MNPLSYLCFVFVMRLRLFLLSCGHLKGRADLFALVCDVYCDFVTFPFGNLGQVWYLIVSIPDPCCRFAVVLTSYVLTHLERYCTIFQLFI